jgi:hypothetical protein
LNEQFTWQAPFSLRDLPDLAWRTRGRQEKTGEKRIETREERISGVKTGFVSPLFSLGDLAVYFVSAS